MAMTEQFCQSNRRNRLCNTSRKVLGPIKFKESQSKSDPVFFLTNKDKLETSHYEFHSSRISPIEKREKSYVYMLIDY